MDAFCDPLVKAVVVMSSSQVAKTTVIENVAGYFIHHDPAPIMILQPTLEMAESFSKDRIAPMVRDTPALRERVADSGSKKSGNTILHKNFPMGHLTMAGANSAASLASRPIRILLCDEVDRYERSLGNEGDPVRLAQKRTAAFWNSKEGYFSTPTTAGRSRISDLYDDSDQRKFFVPCPHCSELFELTWQTLKWEEGIPVIAAGGRQMRHATAAWFECPSCTGRVDDVDRWRAIQQGEWQASKPFHGTAGFWLWQGYSPFRTALQTANEWLSALGLPEQERTVKNTVRGETWQESGEAPNWQRLYDRRERYGIGTVPRGGLFLTAAVDVQADRLEFEVKAWSRNKKENWSVYYAVIQPTRPNSAGRMIPCTTSDPEPWERLAELLAIEWPIEGGGTIPIMACGVDSGYSAEQVYDFCRRYPQPAHGPAGSRIHAFGTVFPLKGGHSAFKLIETVSDTDAARKRAGLKIVTVGTPNAKQEIYNALRLLEAPVDGAQYPAGYCHHPDYESAYFQGLCAETRIVKGSGGIEWRKEGRNEPLDLHVYNRATAELCGVSRFNDEQWDELEKRIKDMQEAPVEIAVVPSAPRRADGFWGARDDLRGGSGGGWFSK